MKACKIPCRKVKILYHPGVEIFSLQPEVKGTYISKKTHPGMNFTSPTCNMPLTLTIFYLHLLYGNKVTNVGIYMSFLLLLVSIL